MNESFKKSLRKRKPINQKEKLEDSIIRKKKVLKCLDRSVKRFN